MIFKWIQSIIISYCETNESRPVEDLLKLIDNFISLMNNKSLLNNLNTPIFSYTAYKFIENLILLLKGNKKSLSILQLKYHNMIPPLLTEEIPDLKSNYNIVNSIVFNNDKLFEYSINILKNKSIHPEYIDNVIKGSLFLNDSNNMDFDCKLKIMNLIKLKFENHNSIESSNKILTCLNVFENLIINFGKNYFLNSIYPILKRKRISLNIFYQILTLLPLCKEIPEINKALLLIENCKFPEFKNYINSITHVDSGRPLEEILEDFKNVNQFGNEKNYPLSDDELKQLKEFGILFKNKKINAISDLPSEGKKIGKKFRNEPNINNLAELLSIIEYGVIKSMKMKPYLIQILSVASFFLHFINKNSRYNLKGRLAQISTGEGKSLIIAMMALGLSLQYYFVDVITSTKYLAERDQKKFSVLFSSFGVSSSNITNNFPSKDDYNGIILYGTNTDFEFSLLRDGIDMSEKIYTRPLDQLILIKRKYETVIVDESDNLFLDAALNSARIAYNAEKHFNWVYKPIYDVLIKKGNGISINDVREYFKSYNNGIYYDEINKINDDQIKRWIDAAKFAERKKKGIDYVVKYDNNEGSNKVIIVDIDTGRINYGSRWSNGIHEFVEIKENLIPESESTTIASIAHPSFYDNYNIIFGLTGTIGEEKERNEIKNIYHIDSFDVPTNFKIQRKIYDKILVNTKEEKYNLIIKEIKKYIQQNRSILILLLTINETKEFSQKLLNLQINNLVLNDIQKENEESILFYASKPQSVVIATNAAGRGTDIILTKDTLLNGGLHVIIGFFPENSRVEFQGIGRAGRQGQVGSSQVIFSKDETFLKNADIKNVNDAIQFRINKIESNSIYRVYRTKCEKFYYENLKKYFEIQKNLFLLLKKPEIKIFIDGVNVKNSDVKLMKRLKQDWANFFTEMEKNHDYNMDVEKNFDKFLKEGKWSYLENPNIEEFESFLNMKINYL